MPSDAINDEILRIKRMLADEQGNDLDRIVADIRARQSNVVRLPARPYVAEPAAASYPSVFDDASSLTSAATS